MEHSAKWQTAKRISSFFVQQQTTRRNARLLQISEKKSIISARALTELSGWMPDVLSMAEAECA